MKKIAVLGAGVMGHGITQIYAQEGYDVCLVEV
ncbi:3-hydroxyacyl-CoA dehydrogenase NAD-binding domain-containing protein [Bacillus songklensis]